MSKEKQYLLSSSNRLNGSGNIDAFAGAFIVIVMNGFLLFFISLKSLFISYVVVAFWTFIGCDMTGTCTGTCTGTLTGTCTGIGTFTGTAGFGFTNDVGIWLTDVATVSFRDVKKICVLYVPIFSMNKLFIWMNEWMLIKKKNETNHMIMIMNFHLTVYTSVTLDFNKIWIQFFFFFFVQNTNFVMPTFCCSWIWKC